MMASNLADTMQELTPIQRKAVGWDDGALLVLAGPGSGKTRVLTCRIARLLQTHPKKRFRILGLTFTTKAAHEMKTRITALVPGSAERAEISTFHGFCARLLRQHGVHVGLKPNFEIYSKAADRQAALIDALHRQSSCFKHADKRLLPHIDALKIGLIKPEHSTEYLQNQDGMVPETAERIALAYQLYEDELRRSNALDFNSLIFLAYRLLEYPVLARHCRTMYRYWLIDEFQDTNGPQYKLLRLMAGHEFRELFAVADDDQTIFEWNGANVRRIGSLVKDFGCEVVQLTDNFRCPPSIVEAANRLVVYNVSRDRSKVAAESVMQPTNDNEIECREFDDDESEARGIATEIADLDVGKREQSVVLARSRALLEPVHTALQDLQVSAALLGRRDDFVSPQLRWLVSCLKQINRPLDQRNMATLTDTFESFTSASVDLEEVVTRSEIRQITMLTAWLDIVGRSNSSASPIVEVVAHLASGSTRFTDAVDELVGYFGEEDANSDLKDDLSAWYRIKREIKQDRGQVSLGQYLQEMELRSKEPVRQPGTVSLATIHGAKGLEFDRVYLIGLAEEILPSWHSVQKGNGSATLEEERRGCFVAITRTKTLLVLSRAKKYRNWPKEPSRFLAEMGLVGGPR